MEYVSRENFIPFQYVIVYSFQADSHYSCPLSGEVWWHLMTEIDGVALEELCERLEV